VSAFSCISRCRYCICFWLIGFVVDRPRCTLTFDSAESAFCTRRLPIVSAASVLLLHPPLLPLRLICWLRLFCLSQPHPAAAIMSI
jgi:hypothetical protein